ncbi:MAG: FHA domain-containing protein [Magnetococcales bacterium]|nr:FHA domain-containing protein [Magnetococcales bacterium]
MTADEDATVMMGHNVVEEKDDDATLMVGQAVGGRINGGLPPPPKARLVCLDDTLLDPKQKGLVIALDGGVHILGRNPNNTTDPILYQGVSSRHARLFTAQDKWAIEDLQSTNGIWINGVRAEHAFLVPGDLVKIGAIPFQFILADPAHPAPVVTASGDETMVLGGEGGHADAARRIVELPAMAPAEKAMAEEKKGAAVRTNAANPLSRNALTGTQTSPPQKSSKKILLFALLSVLLVGGGLGVYLLQKGPGGSDKVQLHQKEIKQFSDAHETAKGTLSQEALQAQVEQIGILLQPLSADVEHYPDNQELKEWLVRLRFLLLERQFLLLAQAGKLQQVEPMLRDLVAFVSADWTRTSLKQTWLKDMRGVLDLVQGVATAKQFRQQYPQPSKTAPDRPSRDQLAAINKVSENIVRQKKDSGINILLSVQFPLFGHVVAQVDGEDLPTIRLWNESL